MIDAEKVLELWKQEKTWKAIAAEMGVSISSVRRILQLRGELIPRYQTKPREWNIKVVLSDDGDLLFSKRVGLNGVDVA